MISKQEGQAAVKSQNTKFLSMVNYVFKGDRRFSWLSGVLEGFQEGLEGLGGS